MSSWEERMAARARVRREEGRGRPYGVFAKWLRPDDPDEINPLILAARCLGIEYGDPGPGLPDEMCRECWGDRHVWLGNAWGMEHRPPGLSGCQHACHEGEYWLASSG
jgi:hypothetical protein